MDGDIFSSHPDSPELLVKAGVGGVTLRGEARRCAGNEEGAEIWDGKSGAGVPTGDDVTEENEVVGGVGESTIKLHVSSLYEQKKNNPSVVIFKNMSRNPIVTTAFATMSRRMCLP